MFAMNDSASPRDVHVVFFLYLQLRKISTGKYNAPTVNSSSTNCHC